jgi:hypothetical protein
MANALDGRSALNTSIVSWIPLCKRTELPGPEASQKHVREYEDLLAEAAAGTSLIDTECELLREALRRSPEVVHLHSGHGMDDVALVHAGARSVVGDRLQRGRGPRSTTAPNRAQRCLSVRRRGSAWGTSCKRLRRFGLHREGHLDMEARPGEVGSRRRTPVTTVGAPVRLRGPSRGAAMDVGRG